MDEKTLEKMIKEFIEGNTETEHAEEHDCDECITCKAIEALADAGFDDDDIANLLHLVKVSRETDEESEFYVPIIWGVGAFVKVKASSFDEACDIVEKHAKIGMDNGDGAFLVDGEPKAIRSKRLSQMAEFAGLPVMKAACDDED